MRQINQLFSSRRSPAARSTYTRRAYGWTGRCRGCHGFGRGEGAARLAGMRESGIIGHHLLPNFADYLIVNVSLDLPP